MPEFFETASLWRAWLAQFAAVESEVVVGFYKRNSRLPSMSWPEAVDEALCVGWIDGVRKNIDARSYKIRFTPREVTSTWSAELSRAEEALFREHEAAWAFFQAQPPGDRHLVVWRTISAKRAETREARLAKLIEASKNEVRL